MAVMIIHLVWKANWQQAYILDFGVLKFSPIKTREEKTVNRLKSIAQIHPSEKGSPFLEVTWSQLKFIEMQ